MRPSTPGCAPPDVLAAWWIAAAAVTALLCWAISRAGRAQEHAGPWRAALARARRDPSARAAAYVLVALAVVATFAPQLAPFHPDRQPDIVALKNVPPSFVRPCAHLFGTDPVSRDVFSRVLHGSRVSLAIGFLAMLLSITVGTAYGAAAGLSRGRVDAVMMRFIDAALSVPRVLILICVLALWGQVSLVALVMIIGLTGWFGVSRLVRALVLSTREQDMVLAAHALGASRRRVLWRHILPNVMSPVVVAATLGIGNVIILEAGLSYLGIGVRPPTATWGNMIQEGVEQIAVNWWVSLFPGLAIVLTVMAFNLLGDGLRDALDPRQVVTR